MKVLGLIMLAKEISNQPSVDFVMWLLRITLIKIYNENEQVKQGEIQDV